MTEPINSIEAKKRAKEIRERWMQYIASGEVNLEDVITFARNTVERDAGYVAAIRLSSILNELPGWSEAAAISVLTKNGLNQKDTIKTLRGSRIKTSKFKHILESPPPSFASTRPDMPAGWPWQGKLADLVRVTGKEIPSLQIEGVGSQEATSNPRHKPFVSVPDMRANPRTGEIVDPEPFWEAKIPDVPEQPVDPYIDEEDIQDLFRETASENKVDESDIEALLG